LRRERAQVLFLIDFTDVLHLFDQKYGALIGAFNKVLERHQVTERFPSGDALRAMNRKQILEMLDKMKGVLARLPSAAAEQVIHNDSTWMMMKARTRRRPGPPPPEGFLRRAGEFLRDLGLGGHQGRDGCSTRP